MSGFALYVFLTVGLGLLLPSLKIGVRTSIGAVLLSGYSVLLGICFLCAAVLGLSLGDTLLAAAILAATGFVLSIFRYGRPGIALLRSPAVIFVILSGVVIGASGGVEYLPYTIDEFTNWLGVSREIYLQGSYREISDTVYLPGYTPGWRLLLLLPWQALSQFAPGQAAVAPLVLHIGLATLFFEIVRNKCDQVGADRHWSSDLIPWAALLLYLAAEATGRLWIYTLLIEQPQIYLFTATGFYLFLIDRRAPVSRILAMHIGIAFMGNYLLKSAAIILLPSLLLAWCLVRHSDQPRRFSAAMGNLALLFVPCLLAMILWSLTVPAIGQNCLTSPFSTLSADSLQRVGERDWRDLLARFWGEVGQYTVSYKTPLFAAAVVGLAVSIQLKKWLPGVVLLLSAIIYLSILYWYHLSCFGDYYFRELNSIPRFTRVVLQPLHALGLLGLSVFALHITGTGRVPSLIANSRTAPLMLVPVVLTLLGWQAYLLQHTLEDVTDRRHQKTDSRIAEVRAAAEFVRGTVKLDGRPPFVVFISQGTDADLLGYAKYYAVSGEQGARRTLFRYGSRVSWSPGTPKNNWQSRTDEESLLKEFRNADLIWPIIVDPWISKVLKKLAGCGDTVTDYALIKQPQGNFRCTRKNFAQ